MLLFLIIAFLRITFHIFLSSLYNFLPYRVPGYPIALLPSSSLTSPFYVCSYVSPLACCLWQVSASHVSVSLWHFLSIWITRHPGSPVSPLGLWMMISSIQFHPSSQAIPIPTVSSHPQILFCQTCWHCNCANSSQRYDIPRQYYQMSDNTYLKGSLHRQGPLITAQLSNCSSLESSWGSPPSLMESDIPSQEVKAEATGTGVSLGTVTARHIAYSSWDFLLLRV